MLHTQTRSLLRSMDGVDGTKPAASLIGQFGLSLMSSGLQHTAGCFHHAATSWAPPARPFPKGYTRIRAFAERASEPSLGESVCVHMLGCVLPGTMNGCIVSQLHMLFVGVFFLGGGATACCPLEYSMRLPPASRVFMCTFITVKSGCSNKILDAGGCLSAV